MRKVIVSSPGGPEVLEVSEAPMLEPSQGELLIRVAYASLNPLDNHARADRIKWNHPGYPFTPGFEFTGLVEATGDGVGDEWIGRRVATNGGWGGNAEFACIGEHEAQLVPDAFSWKLAACYTTCAYSAWLLVHQAARLQSGQWVAIHSAAGAVGSLLVQISKSVGARVIGLVGGESKFDFVNRFQPDAVIDYSKDDWPDQVKKLTDGRGVEVIFDGNAGPRAPMNLEAIGALGNIIYFGASAGQSPAVAPSLLVGKSCSITGFVQYFHQAVSQGQEIEATHQALESGEWNIPIKREYELEEIEEAHRAWEARELVGRTLIRVGGDLS